MLHFLSEAVWLSDLLTRACQNLGDKREIIKSLL